MTRNLVPTWTCSRCREPRLMDQAAETCERCEQVVCRACWDSETGLCEPCGDNLTLSADALLLVIFEWPGSVLLDLAERARTKALLARFNQRDLSRFVPRPDWYLARVKALLPELHRDGFAVCNLGHRREVDHGAFCGWRVTREGLEEVKAERGAA